MASCSLARSTSLASGRFEKRHRLTGQKPRVAPEGASPRCRSCNRAISWICRAADPRDDDLLVSPSVCPVPKEQQPIQELKSLQEMFLFDWATLPPLEFAQKLVVTWAAFFFTMAMPISLVTFDIQKEPLQCISSATAGSMFIVVVLVWRLYLGWQHVGDRLISATVEYEETGWYDGQVWVKTPQILMRDRLQCNYVVKPTVARLKRTLIGLGGALVASVVILASAPPPQVNSATADYALTRGSSSSAVNKAKELEEDHTSTLEKFEPWALAEDEDSPAARPSYSMLSHMRGAAVFDAE